MVFSCPGEWEEWFYLLLKQGGPSHAMLGLLRKSYGARIDGFRGMQRQDIQLEVDVKDSKIALKPQKGWSKTVWEPMTDEVHTALLYAVKGIVVERTVQILLTGGSVKREFAFVLPPVSKPLEYIFQASKSGRKDQKDSTIPNNPMSQQACQKMIRHVRVIMAEKLGNDGYIGSELVWERNLGHFGIPVVPFGSLWAPLGSFWGPMGSLGVPHVSHRGTKSRSV